MTTVKSLSKRALLVILDGFGINPRDLNNAVLHAKKPNIDELFAHYPYTTIEAGGVSVGLPKGVPGNSEVGHMNLGAGRPVRQDLVRINEAIDKDTLKDMDKIKELIAKARAGSKRIHIMGLLSDGGVHSHINHLRALVDILSKEKDLTLYFHAFMDGRDTPRDSGIKYLEDFNKIEGIKLSSIQGRSIGMDRDRRYEKIELAYKTFIGEGFTHTIDAIEYLKSEYANGRYDEFVTPILFDKEGAIRSDDCLLFMNFRPDRAIQMTLAFTDPNFSFFRRDVMPSYYLCMTPYVPDEVPLPILFDKEKIAGGMSEYLSSLGKKQFKIAETEKYAHVTFFFNGGEKAPFKGEEHVLIPSPKHVKTYDELPEMSAKEVTRRLLIALDDDTIDFYMVNFANSDMVGHTGNYEAAISAIEVVDECVGKLVKKCEEKGITLLLTADHGNSDQMVYEDGSPHTSHTDAPVPFCIFNPKLKDQNFQLASGDYALKDVSPTVLYVMGITPPQTFSGKPIII